MADHNEWTDEPGERRAYDDERARWDARYDGRRDREHRFRKDFGPGRGSPSEDPSRSYAADDRYERNRPPHGQEPYSHARYLQGREAASVDERHPGEHRGRGPSDYVRADERIHEDVNERLADDGWLDASDIRVKVQKGEVTLGGLVGSRLDKRRAEAIADAVFGVKHTQNNLRVRDASMAKPGDEQFKEPKDGDYADGSRNN